MSTDTISYLIANEREALKRDVSALLSNVDDLKAVHAKRPLSISYVNSVQSSLDDIRRRLIRIGALEDAS